MNAIVIQEKGLVRIGFRLGLAWAVFVSVVLVLVTQDWRFFMTAILAAGLSLMNLFAMTKIVANLLNLRSSADRINAQVRRVNLLVLGMFKLFSLSALITLFWITKRNPELLPEMAVLAGISTLIVVPLGSGWVWQQSQKSE